MSTYEKAGVNVHNGDQASKNAYKHAKNTFPSRENMIGAAVKMDGGFAGLLDFGDFYLVQNDDGVGTKIEIARKLNKFDTLGQDLLAMVADDAICMGAEVVSITNTIDCQRVDPDQIDQMMGGLSKACIEQKILIPGGEIAEMNSLVNGYIWNAAAVGIVAKDKVITGQNIQAGDVIIGLKSQGLRSNGFSLVRMILEEKLGNDWHLQAYENEFDEQKFANWGEATLVPSRIFHKDLLEILGRYGQERKINMKGIVHVTGGGIRGNFGRILPDGLGIDFDNLIEPLPLMKKLLQMGNVEKEEAYKTWNMGMAMGIFVSEKDAENLQEELSKLGIANQLVGRVSNQPGINF